MEEFESYIVSRYQSEHTRRAYIADVKGFLDGGYSFDKSGVERYIVELSKRGISRRSIKRKLSSVSLFFRFLKDRGFVDVNPVELVDKPKQEKSLPKFLSVDDVITLLGSVKDARDRAILELLYSSSLRASEIMGLNVEDIDFEHLRIKVKRKGGSISYVPLNSRASSYIKRYIGQRRSGPLFLSRYGKRLTTRSLQKIVKKYALGSLFKDISPHTLRHSRATHLLNSGMDIRLLQKFMGHSSIRATQIYLHLNLKELAETYDSTHPLAMEDPVKNE